MANDLGDSHISSLQQGGMLPNQSKECRVVGKVHLETQSNLNIEFYPLFNNLSVDILLLDSNCNTIDSITGIGDFSHDFTILNEDLYTIKIRNTTENQMGQKCWLKVTYNAPTEPNLNISKNKCLCNSPNSTIDFEKNDFIIYPNPVVDFLNILDRFNIKNQSYCILNINGEIIKNGNLNNGKIFLGDLENGIYLLKYSQRVIKISKI
jgi:alpha-amylase